MGTDIHFVVQKRVNDKWEDLTVDKEDYDNYDHATKYYPRIAGEFHWTGGRHYYIFAWLANVRNGYGFAGVKTFEPVRSLTDQRGLPEGFEVGKYNEEKDDYVGGPYLGDHSFGWALASEILAHPRRAVQESGVLTVEAYKALRDEGKEPESWSGDIWGKDIKVVDSKDFEKEMKDPEPGKKIYVRASWTSSKDHLDEFVNATKEVAEKYGAGNVRIVFGFDS